MDRIAHFYMLKKNAYRRRCQDCGHTQPPWLWRELQEFCMHCKGTNIIDNPEYDKYVVDWERNAYLYKKEFYQKAKERRIRYEEFLKSERKRLKELEEKEKNRLKKKIINKITKKATNKVKDRVIKKTNNKTKNIKKKTKKVKKIKK